MAEIAYLDHNATTPVRPEAAAAVARVLAAVGNPSSVHRCGRLARRTLERARDAVAILVGAAADHIVFTSGGTEANALALRGAGRDRVIVSAVEHPSVLDAVAGAERVPVDAEGRVDVDRLDALLAADDRPALVAVMLANNETGVLQPLGAVVEVARRHGARVHCDAVQAAGKIAVDVDTLGVDTLALSAHKLGGPSGCGALVVREGTPLEAQLKGGGQERRLRAGTENVAGIAGFGAAAERAAAELDAFAGLAELRARIDREVCRIAPAARVLGQAAPRLPNTTCLTMPGVGSDTQVIAFDLAGVAVSAGSACSSGTVAPSHVLRAMGVEDEAAGCAIRVSLGWTTTAADADRFLAAWRDLYARAVARPRAVAPAA